MKLFTATLATLLIASPAMASARTDALQQVLDLKKQSLTAYKQGNKTKACNLYIQSQDLSEAKGLSSFMPINGSSAKAQELQHQNNELTAKINAKVNDTGKILCGSRWVYRNLPTYYLRSSSRSLNTSINVSNTGGSVSANIRNRCEKKWGTDYRMVAYCVKKQTEAARSLGY